MPFGLLIHSSVLLLFCMLFFLGANCNNLTGYECGGKVDCKDGKICIAGKCKFPVLPDANIPEYVISTDQTITCTSGTLCDGACVNLQVNPNHCGSCNNNCNNGSSNATCCFGTCQITTKEECNGKDDNCDGYVDEGCADNRCSISEQGTTRPCTVVGKLGACAVGTQICQNGAWSTCTQTQQPTTEVCNAKDDNCDGQIDENGKPCLRVWTRPILLTGPTAHTGMLRPHRLVSDPLGTLYVIYKEHGFIHKVRRDDFLEIHAGSHIRNHTNGTQGKGSFYANGGVYLDTDGTLYLTDIEGHTIRKVTPDGTITTIGGKYGLPGGDNGPLANAKFKEPSDIVKDSKGNFFVSNMANKQIKKITPLANNPTVSTFVGTNFAFLAPRRLAIDSKDNLYLLDGEYHLRKITPDGKIITLIGNNKTGHKDGPLASAQFDKLAGIAIDRDNTIYLAENAPYGRIRKITPDQQVTTIVGSPPTSARSGFIDGPGQSADPTKIARLSTIADLALDGRKRLYILESGNHAIRVLSLESGIVSTKWGIPQPPNAPVNIETYQPTGPVGLTINGNTLYLAESETFQVTAIKAESNGTTVSLLVGGTEGAGNGTGTETSFGNLENITYCPFYQGSKWGPLFLSEVANHRIRYIDPTTRTVKTLSDLKKKNENGTTTEFRFDQPRSTLCLANGTIYVANSFNHTIRTINPNGVVSLLAGIGGQSGKQDNKGTKASFNGPHGIAIDTKGNIFVADTRNHKIRKITPDGTVSTYAGTGTAGHKDGIKEQSLLRSPTALTFDLLGNLYILEYKPHNTQNTIRKINTKGELWTPIGTPTKQGFQVGDPKQAILHSPHSLLWWQGKLYITDQGNDVILEYRP